MFAGLTICSQFIEEFDSCCLEDHKPVYEIRVRTGAVWPIVVLKKVRHSLHV